MLETTRSEVSKTRRLAAIQAVVIVAVIGSLAATASAQTLQAQLQVGAAPPITVTDNGAGDTSPIPGFIQFSGPVGSLVVNMVVGQSKPFLGAPTFAEMDLSVVSRQGAGSGNDLITVKLTDTNFPGVINGVGVLTSSVGGNADNPATFQSFVDPANTAFNTGAGTCSTPLQGLGGTVSANCPINGPFSMTLVAQTTLGSRDGWSFDLYTTMDLPECGAIGDFVWHDVNHNGTQDPGEPGINGVTVNLSNAGGPLASYITGPNPVGGAPGYYQFTNVCEGTYFVDVDESTLPLGFTPTLKDVGDDTTDNDSDGGAVTVVAPSGVFSNQTIDFGFETPCDGSIGNFVWHDLNRNGLQDAGEPGLDGVVLQLNGGPTTITAGGGKYLFTGLCAGDYTVTVLTPPPGMSPTDSLAGDPELDSNGSPTSTTLVGDNDSDLTLDFGYVTPCDAAIGNFVWLDQNRNGVQDAGEPGIQGVRVELLDGSGNFITFTTTDVNGFYLFGGLCGADYKVKVPTPQGPLTGLDPSPTSPPAGGTPTTDSNPNPSPLTLPDGVTDLTHDFGFMPPCAGTIGDFVWYDLNANGVQDAGEAGINGVSMELRRASDFFLLAVTTTINHPSVPGATGYYQFSGLCGGDYKVVAVPPAGHTASPTGAGTPATDSNPNPALVNLPNDFASNQTIDFGFYQPAALGDFVWYDLDADGQQDAGEPGIAGAPVQLQTCGGGVLANSATNAAGFYLFNNLAPGCYRVLFGVPAGFTQASPANVGNDATDSDRNTATGLTGDYTLVANETNLTVDAGFYKLAAIGDYVWHDINTNGQQNAGEPGIPNVSVTLKQCVTNAVVGNQLTSATGFYLFSGLTPGCYYVTFATPAGFTPTLSNVGSDITDSDAVAGVTGNYTLAAGDTDLTVDAGYFKTAPPCPPTQFTLTGNTSTTGTKGNIRTFSAGGVSVKASGFSRTDSTGAWSAAYLGAYSHGLGVTDTSESGADPTHTVDNMGGRDNYVLFEFSQPVTVSQAFLDYVGADSDITVWIGTKNDPYNNHLTLSDALLASLLKEDDDTTSADSRWAQFNGGNVSGNVLIIATSTSDTTPDDSFKLKKIEIACVPPPPCVTATFTLTGNTAVSGTKGNIRTFSAGGVSVKASGFSRVDGTGAWSTAYLGSYSGGLGVTDTSETGANDTHKTDNIGGRDNYVLFEFSQPVIVTKAFLDSIGADSDITVWVGTAADPFNNHLTLSDALLNGFTKEDNNTASTAPRSAVFNSAGATGNVLIIAASTSDADPEDAFKIKTINIGCVPESPCVDGTFTLTGSTSVTGSAGNIRTFTVNGVSVKASGFSRADSNGAWAAGYLGSYSGGLGVTDSGENGANDTHKVDNIGGRDNYVLFEFSETVTVSQALLDAVSGDSDITVWIGTKTNPFNNHNTLSDAFLTSLTKEDNDTTLTGARTASFNAGKLSGNVLVIAASTSDTTPDDNFKIKQITIICP